MDSPTPPVPAPQPPVAGKKRLVIKTMAITLAVLIVGGGVAFGYWSYQKDDQASQTSTDLPSLSSQNQSPQPEQTASSSDSADQDVLPPSEDKYDPYIDQQCHNHLGVLPSKSGIVQWQQPEKLADLHFVSYDQDYYYDHNYRVGRIISGKYQGGDFILSVVQPDGMGFTDYNRMIRKDGKYYFLSRYSQSSFDKDGKLNYYEPVVKIISDPDFTLPDLDFPKNVTSPDGKIALANVAQMGFFRDRSGFFCGDNLVKVFTDPEVGDVYTDIQNENFNPHNGFYIKIPDSTLTTYQLDIGFVGKDNVPLVTWNNGQKNKDEYSYQKVGGCGASNFRYVVDLKESELTQVGTTFNGQQVYGYKDSKAKDLQDLYDGIYTPGGEQKVSYSAFIAGHPVFFWKDPLGMFVRFQKKVYLPMAECAKPVIYLYPEKSQKVNVQLDPAGGFTYTEPEYGNGWNVLANPDGQLTNLTDGKTYPYLFWEGRGGIYESPSKGFVVAQADIHLFLIDKLHQLGLNDKETADFLDYWEPKMQGSPYYFVSFYTNSAVDRLAPLSISPKPDTIIRILMDFKPLQQPIQAQGYEIHTPQRKGFTVVEWGGVLK